MAAVFTMHSNRQKLHWHKLTGKKGKKAQKCSVGLMESVTDSEQLTQSSQSSKECNQPSYTSHPGPSSNGPMQGLANTKMMVDISSTDSIAELCELISNATRSGEDAAALAGVLSSKASLRNLSFFCIHSLIESVKPLRFVESEGITGSASIFKCCNFSGPKSELVNRAHEAARQGLEELFLKELPQRIPTFLEELPTAPDSDENATECTQEAR